MAYIIMAIPVLPAELNFELASALPDNRSYELRTQSNTSSTFTTAGGTIQISLPQLNRSFYESNTMYLTGRVNVVCAGVAGTDTLYVAPSGAYSFFSRWTVRTSGGQTLDDIQNPGYIANLLLNVGLTSSERQAMANTILLRQTVSDDNLGLQFNTTATAGQMTTLDFSIPMIGLLNMTKYLPAYGAELILELTLAPSNVWAIPATANAAVNSFTFSNIELVTQVLEFSPAAFQMISQQYGDKIVIKSETYSFGSSNLPAGASGIQDINFAIRTNSLKRLFVVCSPNDVAEGIGYGAVNPNANSIAFINNGVSYPQRPMQLSRPAETFAQLLKAFGGLYSADKSTHISLNGFRRASTAYVAGVFSAYNATRLAASMTGNPNKHFIVLDLEAMANHKELMYSGVNTSGSSSNYIRLDIGTQLANVAHTVCYFSCHDALLNIDLTTGIVSTIV